ncbi:hypothetical protein ACLESD_07535 [Pyxidicoccus sp. 3LFB2]
MKKTILAALAGFTVAFVAGVVSSPRAEAAPLCKTNTDCAGFTCSTPEQFPVCYRPAGSVSGYCRCVF